MEVKIAYQPPRPRPGTYLIRIMEVQQTADSIILKYDIAVGPCAGYAYTFYLQGGKWPLAWYIKKKAGQMVLKCILHALNRSGQPALTNILDAAGRTLAVEIDLYEGTYLQVRKCFPASSYCITPDDIRTGTENWSCGRQDTVRATILAHLSGLPVLCADTHERESPMVDWCAENQIILLPATFPAGDYMIPGGDIIVDRKANLAELHSNFAGSADRVSYENSAFYAAAMGKRLIYIVGTSPDDHVSKLEDLKYWSSRHPRYSDKQMNGAHLYEQLIRYKRLHTNTDFWFVPSDKLCETIYRTVRQPTACVPTHKILSA